MTSMISPKILVVDDKNENLTAARQILNKIPGDVVCVNSGSEALKHILREDFAVVLMDVQMPYMNGFETAELIRCNESTKSTPIIFLTAINKEERYVHQGYQLGAVDYLFKPVDPQILRYKVSVFTELFCQRSRSASLAKQHQLILDSVQEAVLGVDKDGRIKFSNPTASKLLGAVSDELKGCLVSDYIEGYEDRPWERTDIYRICSENGSYTRRDLHFKTIKGEVFPVELSASIMINADNEVEGFVFAFNDITDRLKAQQQLIRLAEFDPLTGLANRRHFYQLLPKLLARAARQKHRVSLLYLDLDNFKSINDTLGHVIGDLLLSQVATRLTSCVRDTDTVVRLGGDEFAVVLEGDMDVEGSVKIANILLKSITKPFSLNNNTVYCSASIGIALTTIGEQRDPNSLVKAADAAMYHAKRSGRNRIQCYNEAIDKKLSFKANVEMQMQYALSDNQFHLVYQPKIEIESGNLKGFEALIRWSSPELGSISPATFIPIAEECGRIKEVGSWVLVNALKQLSEWQKANLLCDKFRLSINFSVKQIMDKKFLQGLETLLNKFEIEPKYIDVEITETTLMASPNSVVPILKTLSQLGASISVDDFGTGYSSLSYLNILPIHILKIDQSFIKDLFRDTNSEVITKSIINLSHSLDLRVTAEGVESKEQYDFLKKNGCDFGQGYLHGKPMLAKNAIALMEKNRYL